MPRCRPFIHDIDDLLFDRRQREPVRIAPGQPLGDCLKEGIAAYRYLRDKGVTSIVNAGWETIVRPFDGAPSVACQDWRSEGDGALKRKKVLCSRQAAAKAQCAFEWDARRSLRPCLNPILMLAVQTASRKVGVGQLVSR